MSNLFEILFWFGLFVFFAVFYKSYQGEKILHYAEFEWLKLKCRYIVSKKEFFLNFDPYKDLGEYELLGKVYESWDKEEIWKDFQKEEFYMTRAKKIIKRKYKIRNQ